MERNKKLIEVLQNEQFQQEVQNVQTSEELQKLLANYGAEMSLDEIEKFCEQVAIRVDGNGELSEGELEDVAGGRKNDVLKKVTRFIVKVLKNASCPRPPRPRIAYWKRK